MTTKYSPGFLSHTERDMLRKLSRKKFTALEEFNRGDRDYRRFRQATNVSLKPAIRKIVK
tara:strand:+ start:419 stop:598 length:180 start_codon:yes stop_codon:yes gene_type:complete